MITLRTVLGERYSGLVNEDRPDLQMPDHSLGIEVTRAMEESKTVADSLLLEMAGMMAPDSDADAGGAPADDGMEEDNRSILESGYAYGLQGGKYIGKKEYEYWALAQPLRRIIGSKVEKVGSGFYGSFGEFGLYVFCKDHLDAEEVSLAAEYTSDLQKGLEMSYSHLYLSLIDSLYVCDMRSGEISCHGISRSMCRAFFREAVRQ